VLSSVWGLDQPTYLDPIIDWGHPLARGLRCAILWNRMSGVGSPLELRTRSRLALKSGTPPWKSLQGVIGVYFTGGAYSDLVNTGFINFGGDYTTYTRLTSDAHTSYAAYGSIYMRMSSGSNIAYGLTRNASTNNLIVFHDTASGGQVITTTIGNFVGLVRSITLTYKGTTLTDYLDGKQNGQFTFSVPPTTGTGALRWGNGRTATENSSNTPMTFYAWDYALPPDLVRLVSLTPYAFFRRTPILVSHRQPAPAVTSIGALVHL
jgi:hypothetical protein